MNSEETNSLFNWSDLLIGCLIVIMLILFIFIKNDNDIENISNINNINIIYKKIYE